MRSFSSHHIAPPPQQKSRSQIIRPLNCAFWTSCAAALRIPFFVDDEGAEPNFTTVSRSTFKSETLEIAAIIQF